MKKTFASVVFTLLVYGAIAQYNTNSQGQQGQNATPQQTPNSTTDQYQNGNQNGTQNGNQNGTQMGNQNPSGNQSMSQTNDWDLYGGSTIESNRVPQSVSSSFSSKYPSHHDAMWYSYEKGYIAAYPGENHMYEGVLYDKSGTMTGTVKRVKYSTLSSSVTANMKKKYPSYTGEYVYEVTSPTGKKTYVAHVNGQWSNFSDSGMYMENK
jgi:hypothetical protein